MKKKFLAILSAAMMFSVMGAGSAGAAPAKAVPTKSHITLKSGSVNIYDYGDVKLHAYFTNDPLADVAYIVEGKEALAGIELPAFTAGLNTWKDYVESLGKPMNDIFIVCHPAGASYIKGMNVYGTEGAQKSIVSGSTGATTQGLFAAFGTDFHGGDDTAAITNTVSGKVQLAGVDFEVIDRGESYDLAIPSLNVVYTHMLGKTTHSILTSEAHIEAFLQMLKEYQAAGYAMILTSHGGPEGQDAVAEKISYLNKTKEIMQQSKTADEFKANMKAAFPAYDGENYLDMTAGFLYK